MSNNKTVKWKRFTRASYALFNSLHREVAIGVLTVAMLQSAGFKAKAASSVDGYINGGLSSAIASDGDILADSLGIALGDINVLGTRVPLTES